MCHSGEVRGKCDGSPFLSAKTRHVMNDSRENFGSDKEVTVISDVVLLFLLSGIDHDPRPKRPGEHTLGTSIARTTVQVVSRRREWLS